MSIAQTILYQLGGNRFIAMTGAKGFATTNGNNLIAFLPNNFAKNTINLIEITLTPTDTYDFGFYYVSNKKINGYNKSEWVEKSLVKDVYCDQLESIFTDETGLNTFL